MERLPADPSIPLSSVDRNSEFPHNLSAASLPYNAAEISATIGQLSGILAQDNLLGSVLRVLVRHAKQSICHPDDLPALLLVSIAEARARK
jgi:hypothetical protein